MKIHIGKFKTALCGKEVEGLKITHKRINCTCKKCFKKSIRPEYMNCYY